jgi:hypothetical protein
VQSEKKEKVKKNTNSGNEKNKPPIEIRAPRSDEKPGHRCSLEK